MILAVTGHRPDKLGGWKTPNPTYYAVKRAIDMKLVELKPEMLITGMSQGVDQWTAELCIENDIPFIAAVPCEGQELIWPPQAQAWYHHILSKAKRVHLVSKGPYSAAKMHARNDWMLKNCHALLAVWNGTAGGTGSTVAKAQERNKKIIFVDLPGNIPPQVQKTEMFPEPAVLPEPNDFVKQYVDKMMKDKFGNPVKKTFHKVVPKQEQASPTVEGPSRFVDLSDD